MMHFMASNNISILINIQTQDINVISRLKVYVNPISTVLCATVAVTLVSRESALTLVLLDHAQFSPNQPALTFHCVSKIPSQNKITK